MRGSEILEQETPGPIGRGERLVTAGEDSRRRGARDDGVEVGLAAGTFVQARVEVVAARLEEDVRGRLDRLSGIRKAQAADAGDQRGP